MQHYCTHCNQPLFGAAEIFAQPLRGNELAVVKFLISGKIVDTEKLIVHLYGNHVALASERNSLHQVIRQVNRRITRIGYKIISIYGVGHQLVRFTSIITPL